MQPTPTRDELLILGLLADNRFLFRLALPSDSRPLSEALAPSDFPSPLCAELYDVLHGNKRLVEGRDDLRNTAGRAAAAASVALATAGQSRADATRPYDLLAEAMERLRTANARAALARANAAQAPKPYVASQAPARLPRLWVLPATGMEALAALLSQCGEPFRLLGGPEEKTASDCLIFVGVSRAAKAPGGRLPSAWFDTAMDAVRHLALLGCLTRFAKPGPDQPFLSCRVGIGQDVWSSGPRHIAVPCEGGLVAWPVPDGIVGEARP